MKSSNIGGQAVMEGIMMRNGEEYAVAVRQTNGEIIVSKETYHSVMGNFKGLTKIPFIRGIFNFIHPPPISILPNISTLKVKGFVVIMFSIISVIMLSTSILLS